MNREIKFRYRAKNRKTGEVLTAIFSITDIEIQGFTTEIFKGFDWEILSRDQFTGKHDIDNNEFYEGDIIKEVSPCDEEDQAQDIFVIRYGKGGYDSGFYPYMGFYCERISDGYDDGYAYLMFNKRARKIGNCFENPELLE